ncbi:efflux RND transporter periplasmic adaptor subunit [Nocardiopsis mangrovi]|uniref:Efflux RND transporter periplasmic adaptor subunit n=1 Tax=Nocardiopsis mangrovi TaxID=1179818 RepID=A0ABV9DY18_9ACTN
MSDDRSAPVPPPSEGDAGPRPRRRGAPIAVSAGAALAVLAVAAGAVLWVRPWEDPGPQIPDAGPTAEVERTTLVQSETLEGTLGFAGNATVFSLGEGVVTSLPSTGATLEPGDHLYEVDGEPTVLLRGDTPAYRLLEPGITGEDVRQFEQALAELGYGGFTVDNEYTALTAEAVRRWQDDTAGMEVTGTVDPAHVWFAPGSVRVAGRELSVGERAGVAAPVLTTSSDDHVVRVDLEVTDRDLVDEGDEVTVSLPEGGTATGEVSSIGSVAEAGEESEDPGGQEGDPTVEVVVTFTGEEPEDLLDQAPVDVQVESDAKEDVLAVPVGALIALPGSGHGVTAVNDKGAMRDIPVETGWFADGMVEISGDGIDEGLKVVVPK